ncbi:hypothetical protein BI049_gp078 [Salmonella phage vB_SnwM_CGG4-1]|uniref:Uncharacterized protein n=1 Tax=Salmonella phage vB_SnwM_CGG4-1 TaxID=1815631 RepID=A0A1B0VV28_9CAUD|nr:hypothetical protein BI049_gp078 [Salmonella phage vB_SnwM_CGG4-1]ANA49432.1 hypothetical protein CGG41_078 [Salmonella phage vB_SnwM_CGG4-1]
MKFEEIKTAADLKEYMKPVFDFGYENKTRTKQYIDAFVSKGLDAKTLNFLFNKFNYNFYSIKTYNKTYDEFFQEVTRCKITSYITSVMRLRSFMELSALNMFTEERNSTSERKIICEKSEIFKYKFINALKSEYKQIITLGRKTLIHEYSQCFINRLRYVQTEVTTSPLRDYDIQFSIKMMIGQSDNVSRIIAEQFAAGLKHMNYVEDVNVDINYGDAKCKTRIKINIKLKETEDMKDTISGTYSRRIDANNPVVYNKFSPTMQFETTDVLVETHVSNQIQHFIDLIKVEIEKEVSVQKDLSDKIKKSNLKLKRLKEQSQKLKEANAVLCGTN